MATNLPSCFSIQFLEQLLKFLVNFTLLKYVKSQRSYGFLITKELVFGFQILEDHFSASLTLAVCSTYYSRKCYSKSVSVHITYFVEVFNELFQFVILDIIIHMHGLLLFLDYVVFLHLRYQTVSGL